MLHPSISKTLALTSPKSGGRSIGIVSSNLLFTHHLFASYSVTRMCKLEVWKMKNYSKQETLIPFILYVHPISFSPDFFVSLFLCDTSINVASLEDIQVNYVYTVALKV
jgi:hypothetical protein